MKSVFFTGAGARKKNPRSATRASRAQTLLPLASSADPLYLFLLLFLLRFLLPAYFPHLFPPSGNKVVWWLNRFLRRSGRSTKPSPAGRVSVSECPGLPPARRLRQFGAALLKSVAASFQTETGCHLSYR
jgi:hypothetical protein